MVNENSNVNLFSNFFTDEDDNQNIGETVVPGESNVGTIKLTNSNEPVIIDSGENAGELESKINDSFVDTNETLDESRGTSDLDDSQADPTYNPGVNITVDRNARLETRSMSNLNVLNYHVAFYADNEPQSYKQAMEGDNSKEWTDAMKEEYESLIKNNTWKLVDRPNGQSIVSNRWIFKIKRKSDDSIDRFKARLVARGFTQEYGVDYDETFSPVVRFTSIRVILAIAANRKMKLRQFDVKTAFLNGELDETVYMEQPVGFNDGTGRVCKLEKSLYGLKQASRCWNKKFTKFIRKFGLRPCKADPCVFVGNLNNNNLIILAIHVDDGIIVSEKEDGINSVIEYLQTHFEIKQMDVGVFLGLEIQQRDDGSIFVHQAAYTRRILNRFKMESCNPLTVPSDVNQVMYGFDDSETSKCPYREIIGSLSFNRNASRHYVRCWYGESLYGEAKSGA